MFIRGKPIRFGYKIWTMSSANGYPADRAEDLAGRDERKKKVSGERMIRATGTMRNSRTRKIPIMPVDEMEQQRHCHSGF
ncbi:hypothetical protein T12_15267 [Trichinella patagoniensis]|uniref:PiggyBac transposable element-derived protein 3 n=1 Tax=Trichinella patagoniensis TaxID=990121 RepID=A0A0V0Z7Z3_9BILA|nr:hypothetical protein T12_15267 [Trichinella patagoniensis]